VGGDVVQSLWVGNSISTIEQLVLASYHYHGHEVCLYAYCDVKNVPKGISVKDANCIIPEREVFKHKGKNNGSIAPFSDWFRWKLLYEKGGIWADMDMVCLRPLDIDSPVIYGLQSETVCNISLLKFPPKDTIVKLMFELSDNPVSWKPWDKSREKIKKIRRRLKGKAHRRYVSWGEAGPFGFTKALKHFKLFDRALPSQLLYPIKPHEWFSVFDDSYERGVLDLKGAYTIHLWNEAIRQIPEFNKNSRFYEGSLIEVLKRKYLS